jgi:DDE superfamily endonuclease
LKPWRKDCWVIPPEQDAEFVCQMEEILQLYTSIDFPEYPLVCFDETSRQLVKETRLPLAAVPGVPEREDYEYERNGTANLFIFFAPFKSWRHVAVTEQRTQLDYAQQMKWLVDEAFPDACQIRVVQDNLNTHVKAALYKAFSPSEARRILNRLSFHYTPKHGSWLNMAEIELSVLSRQCLERRIPDVDTLKAEVAASTSGRNAKANRVDWRFTTQDARIKLKHLYPSIED